MSDSLLLIQRLLENPSNVGTAKVLGPGDQRTVSGDLVVLDRLAGGDDITDRKRMEAALRSAEGPFTHVFQLAPIAMSISTAREGRYLDVNAALLAQTGYTREDIIGRTAMELEVYPDPADFQRVRGILANDGTIKNLEMRLRGKTEVRTALFNADVVELGDEACILTGSVDITERKAAAAALAESEERYRTLIENANDIVATMDLDFRFTSVNAAAQRLLGYSPEELIGTPLSQYVTEKQLEMHASMVRRKLDGQSSTQYEMEFIGKTGTRFTFEVNSRLIHRGSVPY